MPATGSRQIAALGVSTMGNSTRSGTPMLTAIALLAIAFGAMTLFSGGSVLFVDGQGRADAGNYVPFVLWFNFIAGFAYILAGIGIFLTKQWAARLAMLIAIATLLVFAAFGIHIATGGTYETRTIGAMVLRSTVWIAIAWYTRKALSNRSD